MKSHKSNRLIGLLHHHWQAWEQYPRERIKLALGAALFPKATQQWLSYLNANLHLRQQAQNFPKLVTRIYRPYALRSLNCHQRVNLMIQHHEMLRLIGLQGLIHASSEQPLPILTWHTNDGSSITLQLVSLRDGHREGDISFQLRWNSQVIFSITLLLYEIQHLRYLMITRLQGSQTNSAQEFIRNVTKALHGLRPVDLLFQAARHTAGILECHAVAMVSNHHRVALNPIRRLRIKFDADKFWLEKGATMDPHGFFVLPPEVEIRSDFSDIPSNKRAQAKRRSEVLRQALDCVSVVLKRLRSGGNPPVLHCCEK